MLFIHNSDPCFDEKNHWTTEVKWSKQAVGNRYVLESDRQTWLGPGENEEKRAGWSGQLHGGRWIFHWRKNCYPYLLSVTQTWHLSFLDSKQFSPNFPAQNCCGQTMYFLRSFGTFSHLLNWQISGMVSHLVNSIRSVSPFLCIIIISNVGIWQWWLTIMRIMTTMMMQMIGWYVGSVSP